MEKIDVACVGILVADILSDVLPRLPDPGELISVKEIYLATGGCASNTAVSLTKIGLKAGVIGKVGNDIFGDFVVNYLKENGVDISTVSRSKEKATSKTIILLTTNEDRRFIHNFGANADFGLDDIDLDYVSQAKALYVGGYLVLPRLDQSSLIKLFKLAKEKNILTFLDVVVPEPDPDLINQCKEVFLYTDYFLPNQDEARILTGEEDPESQAEVFLKYNPEMVVVITMGREGALIRTKNKVIRSKVYKVNIVDPSGGGDAFDAGFIFGVLEGWNMEKILQFASAMGASAVTAIGCTTGVFNRDEALKFIQENKLEMEIKELS